MSKEKVQEILSHVDMTKIDLTSFKISEKKFNELSHLYRNRVIISCFAIICRSGSPAEEFSVAYEMLEKVVQNPELYTYAHIYSMERQAVDRAINDVTSRRDRHINDIKVKAIEKRMKDAYKQMRKTLEQALEHDNDFEQEFDEELVQKCFDRTREIFEINKRKKAEEKLKAAKVETEAIKLRMAAQYMAEVAAPAIARETEKEIAEKHEQMKEKKPFWKRIFSKTTA